MNSSFLVKRTETSDNDFQKLVRELDHELWDELKEDQATYDQYNKVPNIKTAIIIHQDEEAVACGCFKEFAEDTVEVKRMFVKKHHRGKGLSKQVLNALEEWAQQLGYTYAVLETSIHFTTAIALYQTNGYTIIPNYGPYANLDESVCMRKKLRDE
ncbi:MAG TPA: GNAT family N-acetyltransferase [Flavisolibacter sp.]|jgi:GNAT superfamily N-acetyltransferase